MEIAYIIGVNPPVDSKNPDPFAITYVLMRHTLILLTDTAVLVCKSPALQQKATPAARCQRMRLRHIVKAGNAWTRCPSVSAWLSVMSALVTEAEDSLDMQA